MPDLLDGDAPGLAWDEVFAAPTVPHPESRALHEALSALSAEDLDGRSTALARAFRDQGITFSLSGEERPFPLDLVPRVVEAEEWERVARGVAQRVRALESFRVGDRPGARRAGRVPGPRGQPAHAVRRQLRRREPPRDGARAPRAVRAAPRAAGRRLPGDAAARAARRGAGGGRRPDRRGAHARGLEQRLLRALAARADCRQQRYWDYWGAQVTAFDLHVPHTELEARATSVVDTSPPDEPAQPPDWALYADEQARDSHVEMLTPTPRTAPDEAMTALAAETVAGLRPYDAARALADLARERVAYRTGTTGVATSATEAWGLGNGVCQDITHVALAMLRATGLPARYVSGYLHPRPDAEVGEAVLVESHAWFEVWLGEWWGWDPTNGVPAGERHVLVARGRDYGDVTPLKGLYSGGGPQSLGVSVEVTRLA